MATVNVNSITISNSSGTGYGPFTNKQYIKTIDLNSTPWTNNSIYNAFYNCRNLTSIVNLNPNITNMGLAFQVCINLVNTPIIPNSVTNMAYTFYQCQNMINVPIIPNSVTNMSYTFAYDYKLSDAPIIPNSVIDMSYTFEYCYKLVNMPVIPDSVTNIEYTFQSCNNLVNASRISSGVSLMTRTFYGCPVLTGDIYIHSSTVSRASQCFLSSDLKKTVYLPYNASLSIYTDTYNSFNSAGYNTASTQNGVTIKENPYFELFNGFWYDKYYGVIHKIVKNDTDMVIPNNINGTEIYRVNANFYNNRTLTSIDFSNTRLYGRYATDTFNYCLNLKTVNNLNLYGYTNLAATFASCTSLIKAPDIPNGAQVLGNAYIGMFSSCTSLVTAPNISNDVISMPYTFSRCSALINPPILPINLINMQKTFSNCNSLITAPEIPNKVYDMFETFSFCNSLTGNIYIHSNCVNRANYCFSYGTTLIKNVYIPFTYSNGINTLTYNAFITAGYTTTGSKDNVYLKDSGEH